ncbi:hypothetical protein N7501_010101 [Penicillium viridicatum]|nr:hypothetical protein N7501_010101 [Penicillium viridicatum]
MTEEDTRGEQRPSKVKAQPPARSPWSGATTLKAIQSIILSKASIYGWQDTTRIPYAVGAARCFARGRSEPHPPGSRVREIEEAALREQESHNAAREGDYADDEREEEEGPMPGQGQELPDNKFNLLGYIKAHKDQGIEWSLRDMLVRDDKGEEIAYTFIAKNVPFIELAHELFPRSYKVRINKDKLVCDIGTEYYDCEPCGKGKSKRIVSQDHQGRATKVGQLLHIDLYPVQPKGIDNRTNKVDMEYAMIITDDASRFRSAICIAKKREASLTPEGWTEQFKQHAGYCPTE